MHPNSPASHRHKQRAPRTAAYLTVASIGIFAMLTPTASALPVHEERSGVRIPLAATGSTNDERVIEGDEVTDQARNPGAVLLSASGRQHCSASLISPTWVLSARHCDKMPPEAGGTKYKIDAVYSNAVRAMSGTRTPIKAVHIAPAGDQALIELASPAPGPVLGWSSRPLKKGDKVVFYGWGATRVGASPPSNILKTGEGTINREVGGAFFGGRDVLVSCTKGYPAPGDSGGPLLRDGKVVADLSWNNDPDEIKLPMDAGYVPVSQNAAWIEKTSGIKPVD